MGERTFKSSALGFAGGAGTWICGVTVARAFGSTACMNRPTGSCWKDNALLQLFAFTGNMGLTPLMLVVAVVAGVVLFLATLIIDGCSQSRSGKRFANAYLVGLGVGVLATITLL